MLNKMLTLRQRATRATSPSINLVADIFTPNAEMLQKMTHLYMLLAIDDALFKL